MKLKTFTKSLLTATAVLSTSAFIGCSDDVTKTEVENKDIKTKADIVFAITNQETNAALDTLDSLQVTRLGGDIAPAAYENGIVSFKGLSIGTYSFKLQAKNYASKTITSTISLEAKDETPVAKNVFSEITMARLGATVKGYVTNVDTDGNVTYLASKAVRLVFNSGHQYTTSEIIATTDSTGAYSFANLPVGSSYRLYFAAITDTLNNISTVTNLTSFLTTPAYQSIAHVGNATYKVNTSDFVLVSQNTTGDNILTSSEAITYKFNKAVDAVKSNLQAHKITVTSGGQTVPVNAAWSADKKTLTISPATGTWFVGTVSVNNSFGSLVSTEGKSLAAVSENVDQNASVQQVGAIANVADFRVIRNDVADTSVVSQDSDSLRFAFTPIANVLNLDVYKKQRGDSTYVRIASPTINGEDSIVNIRTLQYFDKGDSVSFVLIPRNDETKAVFTDSKVLTLKDGYKFIASASESIESGDFDNSGTALADTLTGNDYVEVSFDEPMDTTSAPSLSSTNTAVVGFTGSWTSTTVYRGFPIIKASTDGSAGDDEVIINVSTLKDLAGNTFDADNSVFSTAGLYTQDLAF